MVGLPESRLSLLSFGDLVHGLGDNILPLTKTSGFIWEAGQPRKTQFFPKHYEEIYFDLEHSFPPSHSLLEIEQNRIPENPMTVLIS